jgi:MFS family permease
MVSQKTPTIALDAAPLSEPGRGRADWTAYASYTLAFLTLISAFNYLDRSILGLALPAIKAEMRVSDTVLGLVSGLAFAVFYSVLGVPIAWLADRYSRRNIITLGFAFWSLMTLVTGFVTNVWQLTAARFLMGAGEASGLAPSNSMISDLFRGARRPLALAIFGTANSIAFLVFFPIAGWLTEHHGWRSMFVAAGIPGIVLAGIFFLTVKEPVRGSSEDRKVERRFNPESLAATLRFLAGSRAYLFILAGSMCMGSNVFAASAWTPSFLVRVHGLSLTEVASSIGPIRGVLGGAGILAGGIVIDRLGRRGERWRMRLAAITCLLLGPAEVLFLLGATRASWMTGLALTSFFTLIHMAPIFASAMNVARVRMRAVATSVMALFASLLGQAVGPLLVGFVNDRLAPTHGAHAIRYSLLITAATAILAGLCFWASARSVEHDIRRAAEGNA